MRKRDIDILYTLCNILIILILISLHKIAQAQWNTIDYGVPVMNSIAVSDEENDIVVAIRTKGYWRSYNRGLEWEFINDNILNGYTLYPRDIWSNSSSIDTLILKNIIHDRSELLIFTYTYTLDGGETWEFINDTTIARATFDKCIITNRPEPSLLYLSGSRFNRMTLPDGDWVTTLADSFSHEKNFLYQDPFDDSTLYFGNWFQHAEGYGSFSGLNVSTDFGATWNMVIDLYAIFGVQHAEVNGFCHMPNGDMIALVTVRNSGDNEYWYNGSFVKKQQGDTTWYRTGFELPYQHYPYALKEDKTLEGRLYTWMDAGGFGLWCSDDYGESWSRMQGGLPQCYFHPLDLFQNSSSGTLYLLGEGYEILASQDHGESWYPIPSPDIGVSGWISILPEAVHYVTQGIRCFYLDDVNSGWEELHFAKPEDRTAIIDPVCYDSGDTLIAPAFTYPDMEGYLDLNYCMALSYDGGETWDYGERIYEGRGWMHHFQDSSIVRMLTVIAIDSMAISTDLGQTWTHYPQPSDANYLYRLQNRDFLYVATDTDVYRFTFATAEWVNTGYSGRELDFHALLCLHEGRPFIKDEHANLWYWNQDETWEFVCALPFDMDGMTLIPSDPAILCAGCKSSGDIYYSTNLGASWSLLDAAYPDQLLEFVNWVEVLYDPYRDLVWLDTNIGLFYMSAEEFRYLETPVRVQNADFHEISVFPNPSNHMVSINYTISQPNHVAIDIYNIEGRLVEHLYDGYREQGRYAISWQADNVSSGTYFVKVNHAEKTLVRKVEIIK